jgi:hypothetical protein
VHLSKQRIRDKPNYLSPKVTVIRWSSIKFINVTAYIAPSGLPSRNTFVTTKPAAGVMKNVREEPRGIVRVPEGEMLPPPPAEAVTATVVERS